MFSNSAQRNGDMKMKHQTGDQAPRRKSGAVALSYSHTTMNDFESALRDDDVSEEVIGQYLKAHPSFLESWIMDEVQLETLERWMIRRTQRDKNREQDPNEDTENDVKLAVGEETDSVVGKKPNKITRKTSLSRWKFCVHADKRKMLQELTQSLHAQPNKAQVLWELSQCIASAVNADGLHLYIVNQGNKSLQKYTDVASQESEEKWCTDMEEGTYLCSWVACTRHPVRYSCNDKDPRFPDGPAFQGAEAHHFLSMPVIQSDGELAAVLELYKGENNESFHEEDEEIANSYLVWGGIALHYAELYHNMTKQRKLNDFMLSVVKSIFQDMVSMDTLIKKVMHFAQRLVSADRASLFLVDSKNRQLYARIFDIGSENGDNDSPASNEIRFPIGTGIAGIVAQTGEVMNIADAYSDPRFNRNVDQITGYVTKSILCMPIFIRGLVIGVVQMVNKSTGQFSKEDEESFEMFAVYCGLALHHAKLYDKIRRSEQKYKVALEIMSYHANCGEDEFSVLNNEDLPDEISGIDSFQFSVLSTEGLDKVRYAVYMFVDLFGLARFEKDCLIKFCLTVRKNYRRVPYHNWTHGFSVANSMYTIIKHAPTAFRPLECLALFIGALCHDLDHRGKNNQFLLDTDSPLAAIYTTSTLEHHHFNQTVTILQQEGHNIFSKLTSSEYKQVLGNIKHCILATDLALFFPNKAKLIRLIDEGTFSWEETDHRLTVEAIAMTACDLCASSKPWEVQAETVRVIFEEFYEQGDAEKAAGREPLPMMDRAQPQEQPASQVGFLSGICIPCYELLAYFVPTSDPLLDGCKKNLDTWKQLSEKVKMDKESKRELTMEDVDGAQMDTDACEDDRKNAEETEGVEHKDVEEREVENEEKNEGETNEIENNEEKNAENKKEVEINEGQKEVERETNTEEVEKLEGESVETEDPTETENAVESDTTGTMKEASDAARTNKEGKSETRKKKETKRNKTEARGEKPETKKRETNSEKNEGSAVRAESKKRSKNYEKLSSGKPKKEKEKNGQSDTDRYKKREERDSKCSKGGNREREAKVK